MKTDWNQMLSKSMDNNPFSTFEWLSTWWKFYGQPNEFKIFTVKNEQNQTILIAPLMYTGYKQLGIKILKKMEFVATPHSDYHTLLFTDFYESKKIISKLIEHIYETQKLDLLIFGEIPENSYSAKLLENIQINGYTNELVKGMDCPYIELPSDKVTFVNTLGSSMRHNLKKWEKQASEKFKLNFIKYTEIGDVEKAMRAFFEIHQKRQKSEGREGYFANSKNQQFHIEIAKSFAEKDFLALFFLTFNDEPVSSIYCYEYNDKLYAYLCGFDPEYAEYRPGYLIFKKAIEYGIDKGLKEFDFLRGPEEYKQRWKAKVRKNYEYRILKNGMKTKIYDYIRQKELYNQKEKENC
jgi:CelD/BcsL family acetyltransferase involved in cellulose biosynthesis